MDFIKLTQPGEKYWEQATKLYEHCFPVYERRTIEDHIRAIEDAHFYSYVITDKDKFIGLVYFWKFEKYIFIEHLAVDNCLRGQNYGTTILDKLITENRDCLIILEIDPPIDEISIKRQRFYERMGFLVNDYYYEHPSFSKKTPIIHELKLLSYPRLIDKKDFDKFKFYTDNKILLYVEE